MFEALITSILIALAPPATYSSEELDAMSPCQEAVEIYSYGVSNTELDNIIIGYGFDPSAEFPAHGCSYSATDGVKIDELNPY